MAPLTSLKLVTVMLEKFPIAPDVIRAVANAYGDPPDIIAFQGVSAKGLALTDVTIANPKTNVDANGFPGNWTTVFVKAVPDDVNAFGHAICVRNASGIEVLSAKSTNWTPLPPGDSTLRKLLSVQLRTREGVVFTVQETQLSWPKSGNSTIVKGYVQSMLNMPGKQIILGRLNTAWKYVSEMAASANYVISPSAPGVTEYDADGTYCVDYILTNLGTLKNEKILAYTTTPGERRFALVAELDAEGLETDKTGGLPHTVKGIVNKTYTDTPVA